MKVAEMNTTVIDSYFGLLDKLTSTSKLDIISKLTASIKNDTMTKKTRFKQAFGAFESNKSAEEIILEIRNSRVSSRKVEPF